MRQYQNSSQFEIAITLNYYKIAPHFQAVFSMHADSLLLIGNLSLAKVIGGTQRQISENICSEDDLRSRILEIFVVKFRAYLHVLGFSNI